MAQSRPRERLRELLRGFSESSFEEVMSSAGADARGLLTYQRFRDVLRSVSKRASRSAVDSSEVRTPLPPHATLCPACLPVSACLPAWRLLALGHARSWGAASPTPTPVLTRASAQLAKWRDAEVDAFWARLRELRPPPSASLLAASALHDYLDAHGLLPQADAGPAPAARSPSPPGWGHATPAGRDACEPSRGSPAARSGAGTPPSAARAGAPWDSTAAAFRSASFSRTKTPRGAWLRETRLAARWRGPRAASAPAPAPAPIGHRPADGADAAPPGGGAARRPVRVPRQDLGASATRRVQLVRRAG